MPRTEVIKNSFVAGEISPNLLGRTDLAKYASACESIQNFIVRIQGGVHRRPGTQYIVDAGGPNRLIPFNLSTSQQYVLELGDRYIRFYTNNGQIQTSPGVPYQITSPYAIADLWDIHYAQNISVMYLTHYGYPPMKLIRISDTNWQFFSVNFYAPPAITQNQDVGTQKLANIAISGLTVTASAPVFILGDIGKAIVAGSGIGYIGGLSGTTAVDGTTGATLYPVASILPTNPYDLTFYAAGSWFLRGGPNAYFSPGTWNSTGSLWSGSGIFDFGGNVPVRSTTAHPTDHSWQRNSGTAYADVTYTGGFTDAFRTIDLNSFIQVSGGYGIISQVTSSTQITFTILQVPTITEQNAWGNALIAPVPPGSWVFETSAFVTGNYPAAVCFFGDRLYFAGTRGSTPNTVWGSGVGDYENFALGVLDASGVRFTINSSSFDQIRWMTVYQGGIIMGGLENEYIVNGGAGQAVQSAGAPITPSNINVITQSAYGVASVQAIQVDNDLLFIQKSSNKAYQFAFNPLTSSYGSKNLNILNEFVTTAGFKEMVYQAQPYNIVWFTDLANNLVGLTYDKEQDVWAWHRHFTGTDAGDRIISIAVISINNVVTDQLWMVCQRLRAGQPVYTIEIMNLNVFMDCSLSTVFPNPVTSLTGLQYLQGRPVTAVVDGTVLPAVVMDSTGVYNFPSGFSGLNASVGINYTSTLLTVRAEVGARGTTQGLIKRWLKLWARLYQSLGLLINNQEVPFRNPSVPIGQATPVYTGDVAINNLGFDRDGRVLISQTYPLQSRVLAVFGVLEISDGV